MPVYLVTYDLNKEANRPPIVNKVKEFGSWAMLSESSYAISTGMTPVASPCAFQAAVGLQ